ncbi:hypothetical protein ARMSODRAFT_953815 [Armillaria solidipes]|uniref:F-box domain-containing protein n=1 Tax=Armillaria solidipes TaxID=1076256 RepID=A0A2H3BMM7_9AGAR|nr:hypothetical protein ARMSODRAFT_953815 [Armillaria solidipes]
MVDQLRYSANPARIGKSPTESEAGLAEELPDQDNEREGKGDGTELKVIPAKRRRTISSTAAATKQIKAKGTETKRKKPGKKRRDLSLLPTMPLDILFTVCTMLSPRDLINLSRVDETFCRTLTANNVSFVWKAVREADGGIEPPRGIPEYRWVDLLFGKSVCDFCPAKNVLVDWKLRRRVCKRCLKGNLISASKVKKCFPDVDDNVLSLIPRTNAGPGKMHARGGYYWFSDITDVQAKMNELEAQLGSSERLAEFKTQRKKLVEDVNNDAERCRTWVYANARKKVDESESLRDERFSMIKTRLFELGYSERDVEGIRWQSSVMRDAELTSKGWGRIRPGLEAAIKENRVRQAKADRSTALYARAEIVRAVLKTYKQKILPVVWREMPSFIDVCTFSSFKDILELPTENSVTEASFSDAVNELPVLIADWQQRGEADLRSMVAAQETGEVDPLQLATTIFSCKRRDHVIITSRDLWRHRCVPYTNCDPWGISYRPPLKGVDDLYHEFGNTGYSFDSTGSAVADLLIRLASRDPATTTADEMDSLNLQFLYAYHHVGEYSTVLGDTVYGLPILTWRECVQYYSIHDLGNLQNPKSDFRLLTAEDEPKKRRVVREEEYLYTWGPWDSAFFHCQHCSEHVDDPKPYECVTKHVQDVHGVDDPRMDRDLFLTPGADMPAAQRPPLYIVECEREQYMDPWLY